MLASSTASMNLGSFAASPSVVSVPTHKLFLPHQRPPLLGSTSLQLPKLTTTTTTTTSWKTDTSVKTAVAAVDSSDPVEKQQATTNKYYFVVANAKFMLDDEEHFQEQLFERLRLFEERNQEQDFWLVIEPKFLEKFPNITKRLRKPAVALVSTNGTWITFMKLRLDRVLSESYEADSLEEALAYDPVILEFEKPKNWVAPYPKYETEWWKPFLPPFPQKHESPQEELQQKVMGVEKEILKTGTGPKPVAGQNVTVHCTGYGKNGDMSQKFWSTKDPGQKPFTFKIGQGSVIKGWDEGVMGMQVGEVARLECSPDYAYGADGFPAWGIQPNSVLVFEIEFLSVK